MSAARISPPGPDPVRRPISIPLSCARRRALGEMRAASVRRPVATSGNAVVGGASPGCTSHAIVWPTGTTSPGLAVTPARIPSAAASTSTTALSVSTSSSISPLRTGSPSCFRQETSLPASCAISSAGMTTLTAISVRRRFFPAWLRRARRQQSSPRPAGWVALPPRAAWAACRRRSQRVRPPQATAPPGIA